MRYEIPARVQAGVRGGARRNTLRPARSTRAQTTRMLTFNAVTRTMQRCATTSRLRSWQHVTQRCFAAQAYGNVVVSAQLRIVTARMKDASAQTRVTMPRAQGRSVLKRASSEEAGLR